MTFCCFGDNAMVYMKNTLSNSEVSFKGLSVLGFSV